MHIDNDGIGLALHEHGPVDAPPILLLHGITASARTWEWILPRLDGRYRVLRLDFRGHGDSERAAGRYEPVDYLSDAVAACRAVGKPVHVVGHSLGGITAATLAQRFPELVVSVVVEDAPFGLSRGAGQDDTRTPPALRAAFSLMRQVIPALQASGMSEGALVERLRVAPSASGSTFGQVLHEDALTAMAAAMLAVDASVLDRVITGELTPVFDASAPIEVPLVAVAADPATPDAVTQPDDLAQLTANSPAVTTHTVAGAGHLIHDSLAGREAFWSIVEQSLPSSS